MTSTTSSSWFLVLMALASGCGQGPAVSGSAPPAAAQAASPSKAAIPLDEPAIASDCPPSGGATDQEIAAQAAAIVPLKPGLTLSTT